jgi:hypothetical protein
MCRDECYDTPNRPSNGCSAGVFRGAVMVKLPVAGHGFPGGLALIQIIFTWGMIPKVQRLVCACRLCCMLCSRCMPLAGTEHNNHHLHGAQLGEDQSPWDLQGV